MCSSTKKLTCRSYDVDNAKGAARPAEWKYKVRSRLLGYIVAYHRSLTKAVVNVQP